MLPLVHKPALTMEERERRQGVLRSEKEKKAKRESSGGYRSRHRGDLDLLGMAKCSPNFARNLGAPTTEILSEKSSVFLGIR